MSTHLAVVIAHHHPKGLIPLHLYNLIKHIRELTPKIILVSTNINEETAREAESIINVVRRENYGYDFWSYKTGIEKLGDLTEINRLLILNDSFITTSPETLLRELLPPVIEPKISGITLSEEISPHIQSFLISFEHQELISSPIFKDWWKNLNPVSERQQVIYQQELGLSKWFSTHGITLKPLFKPTQEDKLISIGRAISNGLLRPTGIPTENINLELSIGHSLNQTHYLWDRIYKQFSIRTYANYISQ